MIDIDSLASDPIYVRMGELYREWNGRINVISRKDIDNVFRHHILHSLCIALYLEREMPEEYRRWIRPEGKKTRVLDAGCGGGFPGIPLAAMFPEVEFTLCDSIGKKVMVAGEVAKALGLGNVKCVHGRIEDLPGRWDCIVSRAVTSLDNFLPWVLGRYERNILYLKGGDITPEIDSCLKKYGPSAGQISTWKISSVIEDEYFAEKLVVNLANSPK